MSGKAVFGSGSVKEGGRKENVACGVPMPSITIRQEQNVSHFTIIGSFKQRNGIVRKREPSGVPLGKKKKKINQKSNQTWPAQFKRKRYTFLCHSHDVQLVEGADRLGSHGRNSPPTPPSIPAQPLLISELTIISTQLSGANE